jgi:hypothetical protein
MQIECRSNEQILDDEVCAVHAHIERCLNQMVAGRCLYTGSARRSLLAMKATLETIIMGEARWELRLPPSFYAMRLL